MRIVFLMAAGLCVSGCATITRGTTDQIQIKSNPSEAHALTSLGQSCQTPCTLTVNRKDEFSVTISKEGYEPQIVDVKTQVAGTGAAGLAGNIVFGGVIGIGTDVITGATLDHVPNPVQVDLVPVAAVKLLPAAPARRRPAHRLKPAPRV